MLLTGRKLGLLALLIAALLGWLILTSRIPVDATVKRYIQNTSFYAIFLVYYVLNEKPLGAYGLQMGAWKERIGWYAAVAIALLLAKRLLDRAALGALAWRPDPLADLVFLAFVSLGEELFFRGLIQSEFGFWPATICFWLLHGLKDGQSLGEQALWSVSIAVTGGVIGWVRHVTDSVYPAGILHAVFNILNHLWQPLRR